MKSIVIIIFSLLLLSSCSNDVNNCAATDPREPAINILIVDAQGSSLIGEENVYKPSEITLSRGDQTIFLIFNEDNEEIFITLYYPEMESVKDYQLKLNDQEVDILNLKLRTTAGECFDFLSVNTFLLNGEEIQMDSELNAYIIRK